MSDPPSIKAARDAVARLIELWPTLTLKGIEAELILLSGNVRRAALEEAARYLEIEADITLEEARILANEIRRLASPAPKEEPQ